MHYSRKKQSVEIDGDPSDVRKLVLLEIIFSKVWLVATTILILIVMLSDASYIAAIIKFMKSIVF